MSFGALNTTGKAGYKNDLTNSLALSAGKKLAITPTNTGNRKQFTVMMNVRRVVHGENQYLISANGFRWNFDTNDKLTTTGSAGVGAYTSTRTFKDIGWFFVGLAYDSVNQTIKMVVNDEEITDWSTATNPTLNTETPINWTGSAMEIGAYNGGQLNGGVILSDVVLLDGEVLTPEEMIGYRTRVVSGIATTKKFSIGGSHSYGENGCQLLFENGGDLGEVAAGNSTSWSITGITSDDQLTDTPGDPTSIFNPLATRDNGTSPITEGGRQVESVTSKVISVPSSLVMPEGSGDWWVEYEMVAVLEIWVGICNPDNQDFNRFNTNSYSTYSDGYGYYDTNGNLLNNGSGVAYGASFTAGDVIGVHYDATNGDLEFYKQTGGAGAFVSQGVAVSGLSGDKVFVVAVHGTSSSSKIRARIDETEWGNGSPPSGALSLRAVNLPTPSAPPNPDTGSFVGNASADGYFVYLGYAPSEDDALTINGNTVTWGTHAYPTANGFKLITSSASYNSTGTNNYSLVTTNAEYGGGDAPYPLAR